MGDNSDVSREYTFSPAINLSATLETLQIQYLDINETRALIIFNTAILNLESTNGELTNLGSAEISVYELPRETDINDPDQEPISIIESLVSQITSTRKTSAHE